MKKQTVKNAKRIDYLIQLSNKYKITGYQMWIKSDKKISQPTFKNFMEKSVNPNDTTLDIIENVINKYYLSTNYENNLVSEEPESLESRTALEIKLDYIISKLDKMDLKQDIMFEIIKNGVISSAEVVIKNQTLSSS